MRYLLLFVQSEGGTASFYLVTLQLWLLYSHQSQKQDCIFKLIVISEVHSSKLISKHIKTPISVWVYAGRAFQYIPVWHLEVAWLSSVSEAFIVGLFSYSAVLSCSQRLSHASRSQNISLLSSCNRLYRIANGTLPVCFSLIIFSHVFSIYLLEMYAHRIRICYSFCSKWLMQFYFIHFILKKYSVYSVATDTTLCPFLSILTEL